MGRPDLHTACEARDHNFFLILWHASCSVDMPYPYTSRKHVRSKPTAAVELARRPYLPSRSSSPRISGLLSPKVRVAMYKPSRQVCDAQSCSYFVIDNHDNVYACAIIASDGTVVLRNASQHHTIYCRVRSSKDCPNFFSGLMPLPRGTGFIPGKAERV